MNGLNGVDFNYNESGWMTEVNFLFYIEFVFVKAMKERGISFPVILFLDNHSSHISVSVSNRCDELGVVLITLYPNSTHVLQPLDCAVFRGLKSHWNTMLIEKRSANGNFKVSMMNFASLLLELLSKYHNPEAVKNGFRVCGMYEWNVDNLDFNKLLASKQKKKVINGMEIVGMDSGDKSCVETQRNDVLHADAEDITENEIPIPVDMYQNELSTEEAFREINDLYDVIFRAPEVTEREIPISKLIGGNTNHLVSHNQSTAVIDNLCESVLRENVSQTSKSSDMNVTPAIDNNDNDILVLRTNSFSDVTILPYDFVTPPQHKTVHNVIQTSSSNVNVTPGIDDNEISVLRTYPIDDVIILPCDFDTSVQHKTVHNVIKTSKSANVNVPPVVDDNGNEILVVRSDPLHNDTIHRDFNSPRQISVDCTENCNSTLTISEAEVSIQMVPLDLSTPKVSMHTDVNESLSNQRSNQISTDIPQLNGGTESIRKDVLFNELKEMCGDAKFKQFMDSTYNPKDMNEDILIRFLRKYKPVTEPKDVLLLPPTNKRLGVKNSIRQPYVVSSKEFREFRSKAEKAKHEKKVKEMEDKENKKNERNKIKEQKALAELEKQEKIVKAKAEKQIANAKRKAEEKLNKLKKVKREI